MRNLKRALSLALSTVMLMGMMVVGTGAAGYDDVSSGDNQEAIEVMQAVGIMTGNDAGNFNPDQQVTRGEMAVIMTKVLDLNTGNYSISAMPFVDVPAWAQSYVAAIYAEGVTGGTSATTYGTDEPVTAAQAALMLMRALGYFQYSSDFNDGWLLATIRQAGRIDLFDGIDAGAEEALTRNEVAQLVLNTLEATMVEATGSEGVQIGDVVVGSTIKYEDISKTTDGKYDKIANDPAESGKCYVQLGEELFDGDLKKVSDDITKVDAFGAPSVVWTYKTFEGRYAQEADYTVVVTKNGEGAAHWAEEADKDLEIDGITPVLNGGTFDDYKAGDVVSYYVSDDDPDKVVKIVVTRYTADVITDVDTDVRDNDAEDGVSAYITFENAGTFNDTDIAGYNASTYEEDAVVAIIEGTGDYSDEIIASYIPESVEGAISAYTKTSYTIGGTKYTKAGAIDDEVNNKVDFDEGNYCLYLDTNGYVLKSEVVEGSATIRDVFYLQAIGTVKVEEKDTPIVYWVDRESIRGQWTYTYYVQSVALDGTIQELEVASVKESESARKAAVEVYLQGLTAGFYTDEDHAVSYGTNESYDVALSKWSDEDYTVSGDLSSDTLEIKDSTKRVGSYYLNSSTQYVVVEKYADTDDFTVTVKTGSISYTSAEADVVMVIGSTTNGSLIAEYVVISSDSYEAAATGDYIYVADDSASNVSGGKQYTVYNKDGDEIEIVVDEDSTKDTLTEGNYYEYAILNNGNYDIKDTLDEAVVTTYTGSYNDLLSVNGNAKDIDTADAVIVDAHDRDDDAQYSGAVESLSAMQRAKDRGYIVKLHIVYTDSDKDTAEFIVVETVSSLADTAFDQIVNGGDYEFKNENIKVEGNRVSVTTDDVDYFTKPDGATTPVVADLARLLGGLYKESGIQEIKYKGTTYKWCEDKGLEGNNWTVNGEEEGDTLVSDIVANVAHIATEGGTATVEFTADGTTMIFSATFNKPAEG